MSGSGCWPGSGSRATRTWARPSSIAARDPAQPNLPRIHLIHGELHDELREAGFAVAAGEMGENITTRGIELLALPMGTRLRRGASAVVELTGLRNPCVQLDRVQQGLMAAVLERDDQGELMRKAGVMAIVVSTGEVAPETRSRSSSRRRRGADWFRYEAGARPPGHRRAGLRAGVGCRDG